MGALGAINKVGPLGGINKVGWVPNYCYLSISAVAMV